MTKAAPQPAGDEVAFAAIESEAQCATLVEVLARQLRDLTSLRDQVERRHKFWSAHLATLRAGEAPRVRKARARKGELRAALLDILSRFPQGARVAEVHDRLIALLPEYQNRHSVVETLRRLRDSGHVRHENELWSLKSI